MHDIVVQGGSLGSLLAVTTNLTGNVTVSGAMAKLTLADATGGLLTFGQAVSGAGKVAIVLGSATDLSIESDMPISSLSATQWVSSDLTAEHINAPQLDKLTVTGARTPALAGDFQADLVIGLTGAAGSLGTVRVAGSLGLGNWTVAGSLGQLWVGGAMNGVQILAARSVGNVAVAGAASYSTVRAATGIGAVRLGASYHCDFLAGMADTVQRHAAAAPDFLTSAPCRTTGRNCPRPGAARPIRSRPPSSRSPSPA